MNGTGVGVEVGGTAVVVGGTGVSVGGAGVNVGAGVGGTDVKVGTGVLVTVGVVVRVGIGVYVGRGVLVRVGIAVGAWPTMLRTPSTEHPGAAARAARIIRIIMNDKTGFRNPTRLLDRSVESVL
jgi:hypothetical protein